MAVPKFSRGQLIRAEIVELISKKEFICSFQGNLFRVTNESAHEFVCGQQVNLIVRSEYPLQFQIRNRSNSMDRFI